MSIQEKFFAAVDIIESIPSDVCCGQRNSYGKTTHRRMVEECFIYECTFQPSEDLMLKLYAYYMQATQGPCRIPKPSVWYYASRIKWNAWNDLGNMPKELAMEKYVEELTKVIETMSYNENVSKFMSLIGPFYEVVPSEELDSQHDKRLNHKNPTDYAYHIKKLEDQLRIKTENPPMNVEVQNNSTRQELGPESPSKESSEVIKCYIYDQFNSHFIPKKNVMDRFKVKANSKRQPFGTQQDMLILTFINLQNSLQEILKKLDHLKSLAKSAEFRYQVEEEAAKEWDLGYSGTAFAFFWPLAVYWCSRSL